MQAAVPADRRAARKALAADPVLLQTHKKEGSGLSLSLLLFGQSPFSGTVKAVRCRNHGLLQPGTGDLVTERRVKRTARWFKVDVLAELSGFACSVFAIHTAVFPFYGQRS
jgi:hypothetical protein